MATNQNRSPEEVARRGAEAFDHFVRPSLRPDDAGKFVAVDVQSGAYEIDEDDYAAVTRLRTRILDADIWLSRAGEPAAYRIGRRE